MEFDWQYLFLLGAYQPTLALVGFRGGNCPDPGPSDLDGPQLRGFYDFQGFLCDGRRRQENPFFNIDLKEEYWRIAFVLGGVVGGFIAANFLQSPEPVAISQSTIEHLGALGINYPEADARGMGFVPTEIFNFTSIKGIILALAGGFLVGFGARYGDGCTSGHAISGLAHLQLPSLITVIGFFIGGLLMTHLLFPLILG